VNGHEVRACHGVQGIGTARDADKKTAAEISSRNKKTAGRIRRFFCFA
jgi:hypothetical protein